MMSPFTFYLDLNLFYCYSQWFFQILREFLYIIEPFAGVFKSPFAPTGTTIICIATTRGVGAVSQNMAVCASFSLFFVGECDSFSFNIQELIRLKNVL